MLHSVSIYLQDAGNQSFEFTSAVIGFVGVLIGSVISYYFNQKLNIETTKATYAVQRKNLIFSKIYKELIEIRGSLHSLPDKCFYFQIYSKDIKSQGNHHYKNDESFYFYQERYPLASFNLWNEIKNDIRNTQIPNSLREHLDKLGDTLKDYFESMEHVKKDVELVVEGRKKESGISFAQDTELFYFDLSYEDILNKNIAKHHSVGILRDEIKEEMEIVTRKISNLESLNTMKLKFSDFNHCLDETFKYLDDLIKHIVDKYEFGQNL